MGSLSNFGLVVGGPVGYIIGSRLEDDIEARQKYEDELRISSAKTYSSLFDLAIILEEANRLTLSYEDKTTISSQFIATEKSYAVLRQLKKPFLARLNPVKLTRKHNDLGILVKEVNTTLRHKFNSFLFIGSYNNPHDLVKEKGDFLAYEDAYREVVKERLFG